MSIIRCSPMGRELALLAICINRTNVLTPQADEGKHARCEAAPGIHPRGSELEHRAIWEYTISKYGQSVQDMRIGTGPWFSQGLGLHSFSASTVAPLKEGMISDRRWGRSMTGPCGCKLDA